MVAGAIGVTVDGQVRVGGLSGFEATLGGNFDFMTSTAALTIAHAGNWTPFGQAVGIATPAFTGMLTLGVGGVRVRASCEVGFIEPVVLWPNLMELVGHPDLSAPGVQLSVHLEQQNNESDPVWSVGFAGGLQLGQRRSGNESSAIPVLGVSGTVTSDGTTVLKLTTVEEWQPLPLLSVPQLNGSLVIDPNGTCKVDAQATMDKWVLVPDLLEAEGVRVLVDVDPFVPSSNMTIPSMRIDFTGDLRLGSNTSGIPLFEVTGSLVSSDTSTCA